MMKIKTQNYLSKLFAVLFLFSFALLNTGCSKDDSKQDIETEIDADSETDLEPEIPENPGTPEEPEAEPAVDVVFENNLVLNAERMFVNYVLPEVEYNKFISGEGNLNMISTKVYQYLKDDFDFLIILSVEETHPGDLFYGRSTSVQNLIQGLGAGLFDLSANYGSSGKLKSMIYMPRAEYIRTGPFLHEIAHTWANKGFLPSTFGGHWGYAGTAGQLGGFDEVVDNGDGTYQGKLNGENGFGKFANGGNSIVYGNLELYLMGLIPSTELQPVMVAVNPVDINSSGLFSADLIETHSPGMMISAKGVRNPSFDLSQKAFTALAIVISKEPIASAKTEAINTDLENFSRHASPDWNGSQNFWTATQGKATFTFTVSEESVK
ncbi:hypothetical protein FGM00_07985 [Aggregatimonas sangjinii]|uniref:Uncharacterized protein n=1 Tax=Aggregatimonas sangjinii TaxID=2583587 RepID=A0A5B7SSQ2_9FLAO|nr:hypothetical protein [Aggregatimonas sangjinii]QCX00043.1 hypothetical protein FGM00_07985 [Aggregatimonas sangjinii]